MIRSISVATTVIVNTSRDDVAGYHHKTRRRPQIWKKGAPVAKLLERGNFLLAIDAEMAWGVVHRRPIAGYYNYRHERELIDRLLELFEKKVIFETNIRVA